VCLSDWAASSGGEENREIDRSLLTSFFLLQTVVAAVGNMGERVLPTVCALSEAAKRELSERAVEPNDHYKQGRQGPRT